VYSLEELLEGWSPARFSRETIDGLRAQSDHTRLHECGVCEFGIYYPQIIGDSSFYEEIEKPFQGNWYQEWKWEFGEAIADARSCRNILDVGCGTGGFLAKARGEATEVVGVDFNESVLAIARQKGITTFPSLGSIPSSGNRFDGIFSFHVLEHVPDPVAFLVQLADRLAPSGRIGLSVPNMWGPVRFIDPCFSNMPPHHATRWTATSLKMLAGKVGLAVERTVVEPLSFQSRDYYTTYWVNQIVPGSRRLKKWLRSGCKFYFRVLFGLLRVMGRSSTTLHSGQSVYVLLRKA